MFCGLQYDRPGLLLLAVSYIDKHQSCKPFRLVHVPGGRRILKCVISSHELMVTCLDYLEERTSDWIIKVTVNDFLYRGQRADSVVFYIQEITCFLLLYLDMVYEASMQSGDERRPPSQPSSTANDSL